MLDQTTPELVTRDGIEFWDWPNGRSLPVVRGADDSASDDDQNDGEDGSRDGDGSTDDLGEGGKSALRAERRRATKAERELKAAQERLAAIEEGDKSELQKAQDAATAASRRAEEAELKLLRLEVAAEKGLTPAQAKRLNGTTREDLAEDADDFLESIGKASSDSGDSDGSNTDDSGQKVRLQGGATSEDASDEPDAATALANIPRAS